MEFVPHRFPVEATPEGAYQAVRDAIDVLRNQLSCPATCFASSNTFEHPNGAGASVVLPQVEDEQLAFA